LALPFNLVLVYGTANEKIHHSRKQQDEEIEAACFVIKE
jgi:hypothetical protein